MRQLMRPLVVFTALAGVAHAQQWTDYATVSATAGLASNRLCYSDGRDIACNSAAPYLADNGNLGIGTNNPDVLLDVSGTIRANVSADTSASIRVRQAGYRQYGWQIPASSYDLTLYDYDAPAERLRITSAGNVGIGTTNPTAPLQVSGSIKSVSTGGNGEVAVYDTANGGWSMFSQANYLRFGRVNSSGSWQANYLTIDPIGNVGIGTTAPTEKFDVRFGNIALNNAYAVKWGTSQVYGYDGSGGYLNFKANGSQNLFLQDGGNVGIGTTSPQATLDVGRQGTLTSTANSTTTVARFTHNNGNGSILELLGARDGAGSDWMTAGTRLQQTIDASHMAYMQFNGTGNGGGLSFGGGNTTISYFGPEWMRINSSGNVGISTTNPTTKLEVNGTISATNLVLSGGCTGCGVGGSSPGVATTSMQYNNNGAFAGSNLYYISSTGKLGISDTNPGAKLSINGSVNLGGDLNLTRRYDGFSTASLVVDNVTTTAITLQKSGGGNINGINLLANTIYAGGKLGIGTTPGVPLEVYAPTFAYARINAGDNTEAALLTSTTTGYFGAGTYGNNYKIIDYKRADTPLFIDANGKIGIGMAPLVTLDVSGAVSVRIPATDYGYGGQFYMQGAGNNWATTLAGYEIAFNTGNNAARTERVRIASNGYVGIGTPTPAYTFDVSGSIRGKSNSTTSYGLVINNSNGAAGAFVNDFVMGGSANDFYLGNYQSVPLRFIVNNTEAMRIAANGYVGIGTSNPQTPLEVAGSISASNIKLKAVTTLDSDGQSTYLKAASSGDIYFYPNNTLAHVMKANGYVGIGTSAPNAKLDVNGTISATNLVLSGGCTGCGGSTGIATYALPAVGGTPSWIKLGTFTAGQSGQHLTVKIVTSAGYNADPAQQAEVNIHFKTSNGSSVDANGFAGESTFYITNGTGGMNAYNVKVKGNASGTSATAYEVYFYQPYNYNGGGAFYTVEYPSTASWSNSATTASDPGAASATVGVGTQRQIILSNVGIGQTPGVGVQLDVSGSLRANGGAVTAQSGSNYTQLSSNQLFAAGGPLYINYANNQNVLLFGLGTGNLGISETNPTERLTIGNNPSIFLQGNSSNWGYKLNVTDYGGGNVPLRFIRRNAGTDTEMMRLNQTGDLVFSANNPTLLSGGSYFTIPNGAYFSGGTVYAQNTVQFRSGIANDAAAYLQVNGGTSNYTYIPGRLGVGSSMSAPTYPIDVNGNVRASGEVISTGSNQVRMIGGNYGAFFRNDGANLYLLLTASGDQYGTWNALRPMYVNVATGGVTLGNGLAMGGDISMGNNSIINANYYTVRAADGVGLAFWNDPTNYKIYMSAQGTAGAGRLDSTSDYNMYFRMTSGNRGFVFQNGTTNVAQIDGAGNIYATSYLHTSDRNLKTNISPVSGSMALLASINGVHFNWKKNGEPAYGVIAQDVQRVMPEAVKHSGPSNTLVVDYDQLIAPLIEAVKTQQKQIGTQQDQIGDLQRQIRELRNRLH